MVPSDGSVIKEKTNEPSVKPNQKGEKNTCTIDPPKKLGTVSGAKAVDKSEVTDKSALPYEKRGNSKDAKVHKEGTSKCEESGIIVAGTEAVTFYVKSEVAKVFVSMVTIALDGADHDLFDG